MANLQVKNLPADLHAELRKRAHSERTTISAVVIKLIEHDLSVMDMRDWLDEVRKLPRHDDLDVLKALDEAKDEIEGR
ncbi:MAG TPA: hypothetical protein VIM17_08890 [Jatrophihabitantaceae bacterium]|jgi:hypothetical protein